LLQLPVFCGFWLGNPPITDRLELALRRGGFLLCMGEMRAGDPSQQQNSSAARS
jgi:hypothetical protein